MRTLILFAIVFASAAFAGECPGNKYSGEIEKVVDLKIEEFEYLLNSRDDLRFNVRVVVKLVGMIEGLKFYGGGIQYGVLSEVHSIMNYTKEEEGADQAWLMTHTESFDKIKLLLWYSSEQCHLSVSFYLIEHNQALRLKPSAEKSTAKGAP